MKKNIILLSLALVFSLNSCKIKQSITDVIIIDENTDNNNSDISIANKNTIAIEEIATDTTIIEDTNNLIIGEDVLILKEKYNIAIILPLFKDSIKMSYETNVKSDLEDFVLPLKAVKSLKFIEGMLLSLENNIQEDLKLNIEIYDNEASLFKTRDIVNELSLKDIDFVIGPILNKNIQVVTEYARNKNIIYISPFSHSTKVSNNYENYIMPIPSLETHFNTLTSFIADSLENAHVKIIYPNTVKGEIYSSLMQKTLNSINESLDISKKITYALVEIEANTNDRRNFKIEDYLDAEENNIVIIMPASTGFVHNMLTQLNNQRKKFDITVFGMPNWQNSKTLRLDYFNNLNVHFSDVKWIDKNNEKVKYFKQKYKDKYKANPNNEAYLSYDLFNYFSLLINKYGLSLSENIFKESYNGIYANYHFEYIYNSNNELIRIENTDIHIIHYKDFQLFKVK